MRWRADERREAEALGLALLERPLPPPRQALAGPDGPRLGFKDERARKEFLKDCQEQVSANCRRGARSGCAIKAAQQCDRPAWMRWLGLGGTGGSAAEGEACRDAAMAQCAAEADVQCSAHAQSFCTLVVERDRRGGG